jgi:hypothetical protein
LGAIVVQLSKDPGFVLMNRIGEFPVTGYDFRIKGKDQLFVWMIRVMDRKFLCDDEPCATSGTFPIVCDVAWAYSVVFSKIGQVSGKAYPVRNHGCPDPERRKEEFELSHSGVSLSQMEKAA